MVNTILNDSQKKFFDQKNGRRERKILSSSRTSSNVIKSRFSFFRVILQPSRYEKGFLMTLGISPVPRALKADAPVAEEL